MQTLQKTVGRGTCKRIHHSRWVNQLPIRDGKDAVQVNGCEITISYPQGKTTEKNACVPDLEITKENSVERVACARWNFENEAFNLLKQCGYHLEHNVGHGKKTLSSVRTVLNMYAFALHTANDLIDELWKRAHKNAGTRMRFFEICEHA